MKKRKLSVAVAAYNGEPFIKQQLESILQNLGPEDEVIVSDDGSTDRTRSVVEELKSADSRISLINGPGKGIKQNIAEAISHCSGDIIFLSDQDDVWSEEKTAVVIKAFDQQNCSLVMHDAIVTGEDLKQTIMPSFFAYRRSVPGFAANFIKNRFMGCCMAFDAGLKPVILPIPDCIQMHDQWIGLMNEMYGRGTYLVPDQLLLYRRHGQNVSDFSHGNIFQMAIQRLILAIQILKRMLQLSYFFKKSK
ncbi:MAG: glycosyltransferase [Lachnospiraceae bacterium]